MKRKTLIITALVTLLAVLAVPLLYGQPHGPGRRGAFGPGHQGPGAGGELGPLGHIQRLQGELNLSDDQVAQITAFVRTAREQNAAYRDQMRDGMGEVFSTLLADPNNVAGAQAIIDQRQAAQQAMKANMLSAASQALKVLTPEQRAELAKRMAERKARFENRRGGRW